MDLSRLPRLDEVRRLSQKCPKGKSQLQAATDEKRLTLIDERAFKKAVWDRDGGHCRCCRRKVIKSMTKSKERAEVHHIHGRGKDLRFEPRAAILVCGFCHERLTGKVNDKLIIIASKTFRIRQDEYTDATFKLAFEKVV